MVMSKIANLAEEGDTGDAQAIEGYACSCGEVFDDLSTFRGHLLTKNRTEKGQHKSLGRINLETGEITMPPAADRTLEQWQEAKYGKKPEIGSKTGKTGSKTAATSRPIDNIAGATTVKFVPRVYTIDYSPILRMAQDAAIKYFGWREDMPFGNFLDTVVYLYFKDKGITLAGYVVDDGLQEEFLKERQRFETQRRTQIEDGEIEPPALPTDHPMVPDNVLQSIKAYREQKGLKSEEVTA